MGRGDFWFGKIPKRDRHSFKLTSEYRVIALKTL